MTATLGITGYSNHTSVYSLDLRSIYSSTYLSAAADGGLGQQLLWSKTTPAALRHITLLCWPEVAGEAAEQQRPFTWTKTKRFR